jgi:hypothetical protein
MPTYKEYNDAILKRHIEPLTDIREIGLATVCVPVIKSILENDSDRMAFVFLKDGTFGRLPIVLMMDDGLDQLRITTLMEQAIVDRNVK